MLVPKEVETVLEGKGAALLTGLTVPNVTVADIEKFRGLCSENTCGNYGGCWTCPPAIGPIDECMTRMKSYGDAAIVVMKKVGIDCKDDDAVKAFIADFQNIVRAVAKAFRSNGIDILALADGACNYCEKCSYPDEPCPYPGEQIPSISGFGVDMGRYLSENGLDFGFVDGEITLYGLILLR